MVLLIQEENVVVRNRLRHVSRMHELSKLSITTGSIEEFERGIFGNGTNRQCMAYFLRLRGNDHGMLNPKKNNITINLYA